MVTENGNRMFDFGYHSVTGVWTFVTTLVTEVLPFGIDSVYRLVTCECSYCSNPFNLLYVRVLLRTYCLLYVSVSLRVSGDPMPHLLVHFIDTKIQ